MRWMLLLLVPGVAMAEGLTGLWSAKIAREGVVNRAVIVQGSDRLYFEYVSDASHRCEVVGIATKRSRNLYVFRNDKEHQFGGGYEGYGFEENRDCELSFQLDGTTLKVHSSGNCKSFCGLNGSIGGELQRLSSQKHQVD